METIGLQTQTLISVAQAAGLSVLLWQGVKSVLRQTQLRLPAWASAVCPRLLALGIYLLLLWMPTDDRLLGALAVLCAAPLLKDLAAGAVKRGQRP